MRSIKIAVFSVMILSMLGVVQMTGCSHDDTAIVTINLTGSVLESRYQEKSFINKIFSFFVSEGIAGGGSPHVYEYDSIVLTVEGDGMSTITAQIPPSQLTYSVEVPSGAKRKFTVIASKTGIKNSGAHAITDLGSNQEVSISINMLPIVQDFLVSGGSTEITVSWSGITGIIDYFVYRSTNLDGPYTQIGTVHDEFNSSSEYYHDTTPVVGVTYYYKVSVISSGKEGEKCDYKSGVRT